MKNESFICENCNKNIVRHPEGSARNHCNHCLVSKHLDKDFPGDRASDCKGLMLPSDIEFKKNKGWMIIQKCNTCGYINKNKLAPDDDIEIFSKITKDR